MNGLAQLERQIARDLRTLAHPDRPWVRPRRSRAGHHVHDVLIVGAGQGGLSAAFALRREWVTNVLVVDARPAGREGPWGTYARMPTLRTVKTLTGPDCDLPNLTFQAWFEAQYGESAWAELDRVPREMWMDYLVWYRRVLSLPVENEVIVVDIRPEDGLIRADVLRRGWPDVLLARKLVLATGLEGSGGLNLPGELCAHLPRSRWAHTAHDIDFGELAERRVGVLGAGASAFDNALVALDHGAAEVHLFARRPELPRVNFLRGIEFSGFLQHFGELDPARRWRFMRHALSLPVPPPQPTYDAAVARPNFRLRLGTPWLATRADGDRIGVETPSGREAFDFLIFGTGFAMDIRRRPELRSLIDDIALWRDRYAPPPGEEHALLAQQPYLGPGYEFTEKVPGRAPHLRHLHFYSIAAMASLAPTVSGINGMRFGLRRLVGALCRDLFVEDADLHYQAYVAYDAAELTAQPRRAAAGGDS